MGWDFWTAYERTVLEMVGQERKDSQEQVPLPRQGGLSYAQTAATIWRRAPYDFGFGGFHRT